MDRCPPEIHALIFSFACSDDGTTGRSLALVSRYIHTVSAPFHWQSLAISGLDQARGFTALLRATKAGAARPRRRSRALQAPVRQRQRPRPIHHLFLSTRRAADAADGWPAVQLEDWPMCQAEILAYASPTLETLAFVAFDPFLNSATCIRVLLAVPLPRLVELTIRGRCTPSQVSLTLSDEAVDVASETAVDAVDGVADAGEGHSGLRPCLRRLHLACAYHGFAYGTKSTHDLIHTLSPRLTHLRLSMLDMWGSRRVTEILHAECAERGIVSRVLDLPALPGDEGTELPSGRSIAGEVAWLRVVPASVQRFVIAPPPTGVSDFYCSCCMDVRGDADVMRVFEAMAGTADERFAYVRVREKMGYGYADAKADWLERVAGGEGCWREREGSEGEDARWPNGDETDAREEETQTEGSAMQDNGRKGRIWNKVKRLRLWRAREASKEKYQKGTGSGSA
ncbi:uncharacterized protein FIBRA_07127 [Fibroporia radiculosa]|uniref:Uncharacterized protein n=1 Tax=Fibroporia radiculosa TaxID=599839 RepID=J4GUE1_9APHY|nr:uncharacterized protein FIBRA_07127 [Fibroporia radiculosa]CCM04930.1 predicted protein [Fibroporia radiculosa]